MDFAKKSALNLAKYLLFAYILVFPFGQLANFDFQFISGIHLIDLIVIVISLVSVFFTKELLSNSFFNNFIIYTIFSFILSIFTFNFHGLTGFLYLTRLIAYFIFLQMNILLLKKGLIQVKTIKNLLLISLFFTAILGLVQYAFYPDLRSLKHLGWDDHYGRLTGTFLDPGFMGIIMVFAFLLSTDHFHNTKNKYYLGLSGIFILTVSLTFSRASYLSLLFALVFLSKNIISRRMVGVLVGLFLLFLPILPRFSSEGTQLLRTSTIIARLDNYQTSFDIIRNQPLFGIGYNNLCEYKRAKLIEKNYQSNACSGLDSSILLLIATSGVAGLVFFADDLSKFSKKLDPTKIDSNIVKIAFASLLVHSVFTNSLFYPWVMGWFAIYAPGSIKIKD